MRFILILALLLSCQSGVLSYQSTAVNVVPTVAVHSTLQVLNFTNRTVGTSFVYQEEAGESLLLTAGHVCNSGFEVPGLDVEIKIEGLGPLHIRVMNQFGQSWPATMVKKSSNPDLCILKVQGHISRPLPLADAMPEWSERVSYIGGPRGFYGEGVAMYYEGFYSGANVLSVFTAPGASGSPAFTKNGVFGVIVAVHQLSESIVMIVTLDRIKKFINEPATD